jgi:hypothetical protein
MHYKCPACRGNCGGFGLKLDDDRITKNQVVAMLDDARKMHRFRGKFGHLRGNFGYFRGIVFIFSGAEAGNQGQTRSSRK